MYKIAEKIPGKIVSTNFIQTRNPPPKTLYSTKINLVYSKRKTNHCVYIIYNIIADQPQTVTSSDHNQSQS